MNPIVQSIAIWISESYLGTVLEITLRCLIQICTVFYALGIWIFSATKRVYFDPLISGSDGSKTFLANIEDLCEETQQLRRIKRHELYNIADLKTADLKSSCKLDDVDIEINADIKYSDTFSKSVGRNGVNSCETLKSVNVSVQTDFDISDSKTCEVFDLIDLTDDGKATQNYSEVTSDVSGRIFPKYLDHDLSSLNQQTSDDGQLTSGLNESTAGAQSKQQISAAVAYHTDLLPVMQNACDSRAKDRTSLVICNGAKSSCDHTILKGKDSEEGIEFIRCTNGDEVESIAKEIDLNEVNCNVNTNLVDGYDAEELALRHVVEMGLRHAEEMALRHAEEKMTQRHVEGDTVLHHQRNIKTELHVSKEELWSARELRVMNEIIASRQPSQSVEFYPRCRVFTYDPQRSVMENFSGYRKACSKGRRIEKPKFENIYPFHSSIKLAQGIRDGNQRNNMWTDNEQVEKKASGGFDVSTTSTFFDWNSKIDSWDFGFEWLDEESENASECSSNPPDWMRDDRQILKNDGKDSKAFFKSRPLHPLSGQGKDLSAIVSAADSAIRKLSSKLNKCNPKMFFKCLRDKGEESKTPEGKRKLF